MIICHYLLNLFGDYFSKLDFPQMQILPQEFGCKFFIWEVIPGSIFRKWRSETGKRKKKKKNLECQNRLSLWAAETQSCWGPQVDGVEHALKSHLSGKEAEVFIQSPVGYCSYVC